MLSGVTALRALAEDSADKPVRVAVVGTGARGCDLIRALTTIDRAKLVALCDEYEPHLSRGAEFAGGQVKTYSDFGRMLKEQSPQAIVVAVPLDKHYELARQALDAGCAVFCEKTMTYSLEQARDLVAEVEKKQAIFQVGLQRRANAIYRQAAAMIDSGMLGQISAIKCQWHRNNNWRRPVPGKRGDANWARLERQLNWRLYRDRSHGLMTELASHQLDVVNWLLGTAPKRVMGSGGIDYWRDGREVFDNVFCLYEYELPSGRFAKTTAAGASPATGSAATPPTYTVRVTYSSIQNNAYEGASELILGTKGTLFLTQKKGLFYKEAGVDDAGWSVEGRVARDAALLTSGKTLKMSNDPWSHRGAPFEIDTESDDTRDELVAFLAAVAEGNRETICDVHHGLLDTATVVLGDQAMRERRVEEFPEFKP